MKIRDQEELRAIPYKQVRDYTRKIINHLEIALDVEQFKADELAMQSKLKKGGKRC